MREFSDPMVQRRWEVWQQRLDRALRPLPANERTELRTELRGHALEAFAQAEGGDESTRLGQALARVGDPAIVLGSLTRVRRLVDPAALLGAGLAGLRTAGRWAAMVALSAFAAAFALLAVMKVLMPGSVGLFDDPGGQIEFGFVAVPRSAELIGFTMVPLSVAAAGALGWLLARMWRARASG